MPVDRGRVTVIRKLCEPLSLVKTALPDTPPTLYVTGSIRYDGSVSDEDGKRLVSPSFVHFLRADLPLLSVVASGERAFGGRWFWEGYLHALHGENVAYNLSGTGLSLAEDTVETQKKLRAKAVQSHSGTGTESELIRFGSTKLEVMYAVALSVMLHVAQQNILEREQGPQALVLCATKDQCDEFAFILNKIGAALHLVVHNLFEPFPSMPEGRRAEVVVGTPPLWESVSQFVRGVGDAGLEDLLSEVNGGTPPTYTLSRWRPYRLSYIVQLVLFDVELQVATGFSSMILRFLSGGVPRQIQIYTVVSGISGCCDPLVVKILATIKERGSREGCVTAEISLSITSSVPLSDSRKRSRGDENALEVPKFSDLQQVLVVKNALSYSRLALDESAFADFEAGMMAEAADFWKGFEADGVESRSADRRVITVQLAFLCSEASSENAARVQELCVLVTPCREVLPHHLSRFTLLFKHLEDKFNGELFDGSVVSCMSCIDPSYGVSLQVMTSREASKVALYSYFTSANANALFLIAHESENPAWKKELKLSRDKAVQVARTSLVSAGAAVMCNATGIVTSICPFAFLPDQLPDSTFTVMVIRGIAATRANLFSTEERGVPHLHDGGMPAKPMGLYLLEECCQYGRVLSYYCYEEQRASLSPESNVSEPLIASTASMFLEFETRAAAVEAVRLFKFRFAVSPGTSGEGPSCLKPRVHLFRNSVYYDGVVAEETRGSGGGFDEDNFLYIPLLSE